MVGDGAAVAEPGEAGVVVRAVGGITGGMVGDGAAVAEPGEAGVVVRAVGGITGGMVGDGAAVAELEEGDVVVRAVGGITGGVRRNHRGVPGRIAMVELASIGEIPITCTLS